MHIFERSSGIVPVPSAPQRVRSHRPRRGRRLKLDGAVLFVTALVIAATASPALAEPLVRGQSATYDVALVGDEVGDSGQFLVIFDAEVAADGSSVVVGEFGGQSLQVGTGTAAVTLPPFEIDNGTTQFLPTGFIARFDAATQVVWAARFPGSATGAAIDSDGTIGVTGSFRGSATFGEGADEVTLTANNGSADAFLARYSPLGDLEWAVRAGGPRGGSGDPEFAPFGCQVPWDIGYAVGFGAGGVMYMAGGVTGEASFSGTSGSDQWVSAPTTVMNGFVARYSASVWSNAST
jgi:hypothetical protein